MNTPPAPNSSAAPNFSTAPASSLAPALIQVDLGKSVRSAGIRAAFTTRAAGNLGLDVGDDPGAVHARRLGMRGWARREVAFANHVHGTEVLDPATPFTSEPIGDAWCAREAAAVAVLAADCLPILFFDVDNRLIAAAHAGRVGLLDGVLSETVAAMQNAGAGKIQAVIGPAICGKCYEISPELAAELAARGTPISRSRWGSPSLDLPGIARAQLAAHGVSAGPALACTLEDPRFFSHRSTDRFDGRHGGVITISGQ